MLVSTHHVPPTVIMAGHRQSKELLPIYRPPLQLQPSSRPQFQPELLWLGGHPPDQLKVVDLALPPAAPGLELGGEGPGGEDQAWPRGEQHHHCSRARKLGKDEGTVCSRTY